MTAQAEEGLKNGRRKKREAEKLWRGGRGRESNKNTVDFLRSKRRRRTETKSRERGESKDF